jgi:hypothetical protein
MGAYFDPMVFIASDCGRSTAGPSLRRVQAIIFLSVISHITRRSTAHSVSHKQEPHEPSCDRMAALQHIFPSTTEINWETVIEWVLRPPFVYLSADHAFTSVGHSIEDIPRL